MYKKQPRFNWFPRSFNCFFKFKIIAVISPLPWKRDSCLNCAKTKPTWIENKSPVSKSKLFSFVFLPPFYLPSSTSIPHSPKLVLEVQLYRKKGRQRKGWLYELLRNRTHFLQNLKCFSSVFLLGPIYQSSLSPQSWFKTFFVKNLNLFRAPDCLNWKSLSDFHFSRRKFDNFIKFWFFCCQIVFLNDDRLYKLISE